MAVQTIYLLGTAATSPGWFGNTQINGSAPTAANSTFGWIPGTTALTTAYKRGRIGASSTVAAATAQAASWNAAQTGPVAGTGVTNALAGDCFRINKQNGSYAAGSWTFNFRLRASVVGAVGHINMRVWRSVNADGTSATEVLANTAGATVTLSTTADVTSGITASMPAMTLSSEYLFLQVEWQETTLGSSTTCNVLFRIGTSSITTTNFTPIGPYWVQGGSVFGTATAVTTIAAVMPVTVGVGNSVFVMVNWGGTNTVTVSLADDKGNTYTQLDKTANTSQVYGSALYVGINITNAPKTYTLTMSPAQPWSAIMVDEFSGLSAATADGHNVRQDYWATYPADQVPTSTSVTTTAAGDFIYGCAVDISSVAVTTPGTGYTGLQSLNVSLYGEYQIQAAAGPITTTFFTHITQPTGFLTFIAAYKVPSGGGNVDFAGDLSMTPTLAGDLNADLMFAGDLPVTPTLAGGMAETLALAGDLPVAPTFAGDLQAGPPVDLAGDLPITPALAGGMAETLALAGDLPVAPTFAGGMQATFGLAGDLPVVPTLAGDVAVTYVLAGDLAFTPTFAGTLGISVGFGGDLPFTVPLTGDVAATLGFAGDLPLTPTLAGDVGISVGFGGDLTFTVPLAGGMGVTFGLGGDLPFTVPLVGDMRLTVGFDGDLPVVTSLAGDVTATFSLAGDLPITPVLAGDITTAAGGVIVNLAGDLPVTPTLAGDMKMTFSMAGDLPVVPTLAGDAGVTFSLAGDLPFAPSLAGDMGLSVGLAGDLAFAPTLVGGMGLTVGLVGDLAFTMPLSGNAVMTYSLEGDLSIVPTLAGDLTLAPTTPGKLKVWMGGAWVQKPAQVWVGGAWQRKPGSYWDGAQWVRTPISLE